jgi:hypothetical protein
LRLWISSTTHKQTIKVSTVLKIKERYKCQNKRSRLCAYHLLYVHLKFVSPEQSIKHSILRLRNVHSQHMHWSRPTSYSTVQVSFTSWHCALRHSTFCKIFDHQTNTSVGTFTIFGWLVHVTFLNPLEKFSFWNTLRHLEQCDDRLERFRKQ